MKRVFLITVVLVLVGGLILTGCTTPKPAPTPAQPAPATPIPAPSPTPTASAPSPTPAKVIELKFAHHGPPGGILSRTLHRWGDEVEKATGNQVKLNYYEAESLVKMKDYYDAVASGVSDIQFGAASQDPSRFVLRTVGDLPGLSWNSKVQTRIMNEIPQLFPQVSAEAEEVHLLFISHVPASNLHFTSKVVRTPKDMTGLKVVGTGTTIGIVKVIGGVPISMGLPDMYSALERGVADGQLLAYNVMAAFKQYEVLKTHTEVNLGATVMQLLMNKKKWNSLPADIQKAINDVSANAGWPGNFFAEMQDEANITGKNECVKRSHTFVTPTPDELVLWQAALSPLFDQWVEEREAKGLPAKAILDKVQQLINEYSK